MHPDPIYAALHPFHQWAQIAAVCALMLAAAAFVVLALSRRLSRRWWLGAGIFTGYLLAVAFGARARGAAYDLRPIADACFRPPSVSGCDVWAPWLTTAQQRVANLGVLLLIATVIGLLAAGLALFLWRRSGTGRARLSARAFGLLCAIVVAGCGAFLTANSVARWIETAYLADIRNAGDGLGQLPWIEAIFGTIVGGAILAVGLAAVIASAPPRREHPIPLQ